jgi:hypothetical protein
LVPQEAAAQVCAGRHCCCSSASACFCHCPATYCLQHQRWNPWLLLLLPLLLPRLLLLLLHLLRWLAGVR